MPKHLHAISMDREFSEESIDMNSAQLCVMNGRVYTPRRHKETLVSL